MPFILFVSGWKHTESENESKPPEQIAGKVGVGAKLGGEALPQPAQSCELNISTRDRGRQEEKGEEGRERH